MQPFDGFLLRRSAKLDRLLQRCRERVQIKCCQPLTNGLGTTARVEDVTKSAGKLPKRGLLQNGSHDQLGEQTGQVRIMRLVLAALAPLYEGPLALRFVNGEHEVTGVGQDSGELALRETQEQCDDAGGMPREPGVGDWSRQFNVPHTLATYGGCGDLHAADLTNEAGCARSSVLATAARPVPCRAKDSLAEQAILLRLVGTAVDGFRSRDFAVAPRANLLRGGQGNTKRSNRLAIEHRSHLLEAL